MNDSPKSSRRGHWLPLALLVGYWLALFTGTHVPPEFPLLPPPGTDKIAHFSAFALLAVLLAITWRFVFGRFTLSLALAGWLLLIAYAAVDELTQPWFRRTCDIYDWRADACGAAVGLALVYGWHLLRNARTRDPKPVAQ
jgi:VanZ family protein